MDETRFPVYVRALPCHLRIALLDWVESDIDVDSHIIFNTLNKYTPFLHKNIFYENMEAEICEILRIL